MIDLKICRTCKYWRSGGGLQIRESASCGYMNSEFGRGSRIKLGATEACHVYEPFDGKRERSQVKAANPKHDAIRKLYSEGLPLAEIAKQVDYGLNTVEALTLKMGLRDKEKHRTYQATHAETGEVTVGSVSEVSCALNVSKSTIRVGASSGKRAKGYFFAVVKT